MLLCKEDKSCKMTYKVKVLMVSCRTSFFHKDIWPKSEVGGPYIQVEKGGSVTYSMDRENEVSKIFVIFLGSNRVRKISIQTNFWI